MGTRNNPGKYDCLSKADPDEPMFVLLGRDPCAPALISLWADMRKKLGEDQEKIDEALACSDDCEHWLLKKLGKDEQYGDALRVYEDCTLEEAKLCFEIDVLEDKRLTYEALKDDDR